MCVCVCVCVCVCGVRASVSAIVCCVLIYKEVFVFRSFRDNERSWFPVCGSLFGARS